MATVFYLTELPIKHYSPELQILVLKDILIKNAVFWFVCARSYASPCTVHTVYVPYYEPFLLDNGDVLEDVHLSEYLDEAAGLNQCGRLLIGIAPQNGGKADPDDGRHVLPFT